MSYKPSDSYFGGFTISHPTTRAAVNADSLPSATATKNGADDGAFSLTVTNLDTGRYKITGTIPAGYTSGDVVQVSVAATVSSVAAKAVVNSFVLDGQRNSDLKVDTAAIKAKTDGLNFTGNDVKATLDGETVTVAPGSKTGYSLVSTGLNLVLVDGKTLPAALQIIAAGVLGKVSGAGTGTETFVGLSGSDTRAVVTVDVSGNRTAVSYG